MHGMTQFYEPRTAPVSHFPFRPADIMGVASLATTARQYQDFEIKSNSAVSKAPTFHCRWKENRQKKSPHH